MGKKIAYIRVSSKGQCVDRQADSLRGFCDELYVERISAVRAKRPVYEAVVARLKPGDTLVVHDLDRAFRSAFDALGEADKLRARGVHFQVATLALDTATPQGRFVYTVLSAFAELERNVLAQRTKEGVAAARRRGKRLGRPPKLTQEKLASARRALKAPDATIGKVATAYDVAPWSLTRALRRAKERGWR